MEDLLGLERFNRLPQPFQQGLSAAPAPLNLPLTGLAHSGREVTGCDRCTLASLVNRLGACARRWWRRPVQAFRRGGRFCSSAAAPAACDCAIP